MFKHNSKLAIVFLLLAVFSFVFFSVGGEFLHSKIHHHKDRASGDQCFFSQLLAQVFTVQAAVILAFSFLAATYLIKAYQVSVFQFCYNLPYYHAPPVSL